MFTQPCAEAILLPIKDNQWNEETTFPLDSAVIISVGIIYEIQIDAVFDFAGMFLRDKLIEKIAAHAIQFFLHAARTPAGTERHGY